jgi:hypothetical protein
MSLRSCVVEGTVEGATSAVPALLFWPSRESGKALGALVYVALPLIASLWRAGGGVKAQGDKLSSSTQQTTAHPGRQESKFTRIIPWILVAVVLSLWLGNWLLFLWLLPADKRGAFGDQFGAVNALFSGLAFAGIISTILLQRRELALQREQLELQREEMREARLQLAEQARVQEGSRRASIAALRVEALKAEISALEMESLREHFASRQVFIQNIRLARDEMNTIADRLEEPEEKAQ